MTTEHQVLQQQSLQLLISLHRLMRTIRQAAPTGLYPTQLIVLSQLFVLRWLEGRSRTRALALVGVLFALAWSVLALAGNLGRKKLVHESVGTFPVTTPLFTFLLISVILIVSALTFFPALSLGPILEHLLMHSGKVF